MPAFIFLCSSCNLQFERIVKLGVSTHPCPSCAEESQKYIPGNTFSHTFEEPATPTNSGISSFDNPSADMAVGRDASKKWEDYDNRKKLKDGLRKESGQHALTRTSPDVYAPMSKEAYSKRVQTGKEIFKKWGEQGR